MLSLDSSVLNPNRYNLYFKPHWTNNNANASFSNNNAHVAPLL